MREAHGRRLHSLKLSAECKPPETAITAYYSNPPRPDRRRLRSGLSAAIKVDGRRQKNGKAGTVFTGNIMRNVMTAGLAAILFTLYLPAASAADDPCKVTLCLWGKMNGSLRTGCTEAEQSFFNIVKKKHGSFLPDHTFDARKDALNNECPASNGASAFVDKVLGKYGRQRKG